MIGRWRRRSLLSLLAAAGSRPDPASAAFGDDEVIPRGVTPAPAAERMVGIAYQLWHYAPNWPAWVKVWGKPELGYYVSNDPAVIRQHAEWISGAGVDFILIDWSNEIGADDRDRHGEKWQLLIEDATRVLFSEYARLPHPPKVAFLLGTPRAPEAITDGRLQAKADQIHEEYVRDPERRKLLLDYLGKPLLPVYVDTPSPYRNGPPPWHDARFTVRFMTGFLSEQPNLLGPGRVSKFGYWSWEDRGPPTFPVVDGHPEVMTVVASWRASPGRIPAPGRHNGDTFREEWALARRIGPRIALVSTFNEWRLGEQVSAEISKDVEPSEQFGHLYLDILREQAALFKQGR
jgi:hypothetical protein